jgi:hypothetical protein
MPPKHFSFSWKIAYALNRAKKIGSPVMGTPVRLSLANEGTTIVSREWGPVKTSYPVVVGCEMLLLAPSVLVAVLLE